MFPLRKLRELSPKTRALKTARILKSFEEDLSRSAPIDTGYLTDLLSTLDAGSGIMGGEIDAAREAALERIRLGEPETLLRPLNALRNGLLRALGAEPAEWDFIDPRTGGLDASARKTFCSPTACPLIPP